MKLVVVAVPIRTLEDESIDDLAVFVTLCTIGDGEIECTVSEILTGEQGPLAGEVGFDIAIAKDVVIARVVFQHKLTFAARGRWHASDRSLHWRDRLQHQHAHESR